MAKAQSTTFTTSQSLKTKMEAKGKYPVLSDLMAFFVSSNERWVIIGQTFGRWRCIGNANETTALFDTNDSTMIRIWTMEELTQSLVSHYAVDNYSRSVQGANITISFFVNGQNFSGVNTVEVEALAAACSQLLDAQ